MLFLRKKTTNHGSVSPSLKLFQLQETKNKEAIDFEVMSSDSKDIILSNSSLNGAQKAAALMLVMGKDTAVKMAEYFSEEELETIYEAANSLPELAYEDIDSLTDEFRGDFFNTTLFTSPDAVSELFAQMRNGNAMSPAETLAEREANGKKGSGGMNGANGITFEGPDVETIKAFFESERPLLSAFLLNKLDTDVASSALDLLEAEQRNKIIGSLLNRKELDPETEAAVAKQLAGILAPVLEEEAGERQEIETAAMLINQISSGAASDLVSYIVEKDAAIGSMVQKRLFRFENIELLTKEDRAKIFDAVESEDIVSALFETPDGLKDTILEVLSQRNRRMVEAELARQKPKEEDVIASRKKITVLVLNLAREDLIILPDTN